MEFEVSPPNPVYRFGIFELDTARRVLLTRGEPQYVSPRAYGVLVHLIRADGRIVSKEELLDRVWSDTIVGEGSVPRAISTLRRLLGERPGEERFILTVPRVGYRFIAPVDMQCGLLQLEAQIAPSLANVIA